MLSRVPGRRNSRAASACLLLAVLCAPLGAAASEIPTISNGGRVDLARHMVVGKYVLFDFYADWCGPCRAIEPTVRSLAEQHGDRLAVRKVDVVDWNSEVIRQFGIRSIPHLKLFGPSGELVAEGSAHQVLSTLQARLGGGPRRGTPGRSTSSPLVPALTVVAIVAVVLVLLLGKRREPAPVPEPPPAVEAHQRDRSSASTGRDPNAVPIWFAVSQGSIEGPYSLLDLRRLLRSSQLGEQTRVRRRGDAEWQSLGDLVRDLPDD